MGWWDTVATLVSRGPNIPIPLKIAKLLFSRFFAISIKEMKQGIENSLIRKIS